jgi:hypothetical protein
VWLTVLLCDRACQFSWSREEVFSILIEVLGVFFFVLVDRFSHDGYGRGTPPHFLGVLEMTV